jgi:hypothetical protein
LLVLSSVRVLSVPALLPCLRLFCCFEFSSCCPPV